MKLFSRHTVCVLGVVLTRGALTQAYRIKDSYVGQDFYNSWTWETFDDPTHGRVDYVDKWTSMNSNLSYATDKKFIMRVDATNIVSPSSRGRASVRIISDAVYSDSVTVLELTHMPEGCGTWPAFWSLSARGPWPKGGEIDIIEGVNKNIRNLASLHTAPGCTMKPFRDQSGMTVSTDCDTSVNYNQGCGSSFIKPFSYGAAFNMAGGGWYVMERSRNKGISVWFWSRGDYSVPWAIRNGSTEFMVNPSWGLPDAHFSIESCDYNSMFDAHRMVFDTTFCGDWAGADWPNSECGSGTCNDFVNNNPRAFKKTYWEIDSLRVYT
ncbi:concanavalin A-like lectin/glucanase domain-containing protein [Collybia nuda]|uniref:Concanavalin A-like lectin/glucanase domain-containing protein n=1 Tax=Collybia nuda TaxID=64659 RepID=A0A9P5Y498_9AGAR|nr:concanavalin A-like lectin/glucanase domain-containing protein [Collybia nuda]